MSGPNFNLRTTLEHHKLTGTNFLDWERNLQIVLKAEKIGFTIEGPPPQVPEEGPSDRFKKQYEPFNQAQCIMLGSMNSELQEQCRNLNPWEMLEYLKVCFGAQVRQERYDVTKDLYSCKLGEKGSMVSHGVKMLGLLRRLADFGIPVPDQLAVDLILQSLPKSYSGFIVNYNMSEMKDSPASLISKLKTTEKEIMKNKGSSTSVLLVSSRKAKAKGKKKVSKTLKQKMVVSKEGTKPKGICFHCGKDGHWKRNC